MGAREKDPCIQCLYIPEIPGAQALSALWWWHFASSAFFFNCSVLRISSPDFIEASCPCWVHLWHLYLKEEQKLTICAVYDMKMSLCGFLGFWKSVCSPLMWLQARFVYSTPYIIVIVVAPLVSCITELKGSKLLSFHLEAELARDLLVIQLHPEVRAAGLVRLARGLLTSESTLWSARGNRWTDALVCLIRFVLHKCSYIAMWS